MRILLTGGGTAGHINPALAIANFIKQKNPDASILFVGTEHGLEKKLVPKAGFDIKYIDVMGLRRSLSPENIKVFFKYVKSISDASEIIKKFSPDVVVGTGGYVCAPVIKAAIRKKVPSLIHEQNVFPGLAIKMLSQKADVTAISFDETKEMVKAKKIVLTGNPLRPALFVKSDPEALRRSFGMDERPVALMFGGSLGAEKMNEALIQMIEIGFSDFNLIAATGEKHYETIMRRLGDRGIDPNKIKNLAILPYIYSMEDILGACDIVVSRAGAITVSELTALGKPAVLIPSPYVAHNHQEYNARYLENRGAANVITENELTGEKLMKVLDSTLRDAGKLEKMQECSRKIGMRDSCDKIYNEIIRLSQNKR